MTLQGGFIMPNVTVSAGLEENYVEVLALKVQSIIILYPSSYAWNKNYWVWTKGQNRYEGKEGIFFTVFIFHDGGAG